MSGAIITLTTEIAELENRNYEDEESRELQRRLRGEVDSLEKYVAELQVEKDTLSKESDSIKEKLKIMETEWNNIWHDDELEEKYQEENLEVEQLRSQCDELNVVLKELQTVRHGNESGSKTLEAVGSYEDFVSDVQSENELNKLLKESQEKSKKLQDELLNVTNSFVQLQTNAHSLSKDDDDLLEKVSILTKTEKSIQNTRKELFELMQTTEVFNPEISNLQKQLYESNVKVTTMEITQQILIKDLATYQDNYIEMETLFVHTKKTGDDFEEQVNTVIQAEYDRLVDKYKKQDFKLQSVTRNFNEVTSDMEESLQKIQKFIFGNNSIDFNDMNTAFEKIFSQLQQKEMLSNHMYEFEELVLKLRAGLACLNEKQTINLEERQTVSQHLKCAEEKILILENTISEYVNKVQNLNCTIFEMTTTIADLKMLQDIVEGKENIITDLKAASNNLDIKLAKSNHELAESKTMQEDLQKSLENLEKIKKDFEKQILEIQNELLEHKGNETNLNKTIAELHALTSVFERQISDTTEELKKYKQNEETLFKTLENLQGLKTSLEHQLNDANDKILQQKTQDSIIEQTRLDEDKQYHQNIKTLSGEIEKYNIKINELELELQECKSKSSAAQNDLQIIAKSQVALQEEVLNSKTTCDKRLIILDLTIHKLEDDLQTTTNQKSYIQEDHDKKCQEYQKLILERNQDMSRRVILQEQFDEILAKLVVEEAACRDQDNLLSPSNQVLLKLKLDVEKTRELLLKLKGTIEERDSKIEELTEQILEGDIRNEVLKNRATELQGQCLMLEKLKTQLEIKCIQLEANAWNIISDLSTKNVQLDDIIKRYKDQQQKTEDQIGELTNALYKSQSELHEATDIKNSLITENKKQIDDLQDKILQLNQAIVSLNNQEFNSLKEIRNTKDVLTDTINKYTESLQIRQKNQVENEVQENNLTENLHKLMEKYNNLDKTHMETLMELGNIQTHVELLENVKVQLEVKLIQQKSKYDQDYDNYSTTLNKKICDLVETESVLKVKLLKLTQKLKLSAENNEDLNEHVNQVQTELAELQAEKWFLCQTLRQFNDSYQELKDVYSSLKEAQSKFINNNNQTLKMLQNELSQQIGFLVEEGETLKERIKEHQENLNILQSQEEVIKSMLANKLEQKKKIIKTLEAENQTCKTLIDNLIEEQRVVQEQIAIESEKMYEIQNKFVKNNQKKKRKLVKHEGNIIRLKCVNEILETGNANFQEELETINKKIQELEEGKLDDLKRFNEEIQSREMNRKSSQEQIKFLQTQVSENVSKNTQLMLELCTVNESLSSLSKQHLSLQQISAEEEQSYNEKLKQAKTKSTGKENILEDLNVENQRLSKEIAIAKKKIENLKDKLKSHLIERQTLDLEINATSEKLVGQDSAIQRHEAIISEANGKVMAKLEEILDLEKEKRKLQEQLEEFSKELAKAKGSRDDILESQGKIMKETENNLIKAHESAIEVKNDLLKRIEQLENKKINYKQLRSDLEKLLEGETVAKKILEIRVLELNNEKCKFSQLFSTLKHSVQSLYGALNEKPVEIITDGVTKELDTEDMECLNTNIKMIKTIITEDMEQSSLCKKQLSILENEKLVITHKIAEIKHKKQFINEEKDNLIQDYNILYNEKMHKEQEFETLKEIQLAHDLLKAKHEQLMEYNGTSQELQETLLALEKKSAESYNTLQKYGSYASTYKTTIEKLITERNILDNFINNLKHNLSTIQIKMLHISDASLMEQVHIFESILEDIQKQFVTISRKIHDLILTIITVPPITSNKFSEEEIFDQIDFEEELDKVVDCSKRAADLLEQIATFDYTLTMKLTKVQKEKVLRSSNITNTAGELKDEKIRNGKLKQRLTSAEHVKRNLDKKIKQLRQEILNSKFENTVPYVGNDGIPKTVLHQLIETENEKILNTHLDKLHHEYEGTKMKHELIPKQIKYENQDVEAQKELIQLRVSYGNLINENLKYKLENSTMCKLSEDLTLQLSECDNKKLEEIRAEYKAKLKKMKKKLQHCRKESAREAQKHKVQSEKALKTVEQLKQNLTLIQLEKENTTECQNCEHCSAISTSYTVQERLTYRALEDDRKPPKERKYETLSKYPVMTIIEADITSNNQQTNRTTYSQ